MTGSIDVFRFPPTSGDGAHPEAARRAAEPPYPAFGRGGPGTAGTIRDEFAIRGETAGTAAGGPIPRAAS